MVPWVLMGQGPFHPKTVPTSMQLELPALTGGSSKQPARTLVAAFSMIWSNIVLLSWQPMKATCSHGWAQYAAGWPWHSTCRQAGARVGRMTCSSSGGSQMPPPLGRVRAAGRTGAVWLSPTTPTSRSHSHAYASQHARHRPAPAPAVQVLTP